MSEPPQLTRRGMTEEQWLACADPLKLPKVARDRATPRKCCLLACAHALETPGALQTPVGRRIVEVVRAAALGLAPKANVPAANWEALGREFPEYFKGHAYELSWQVWSRPELAADRDVLATFFYEMVRFGPPSRRAVNSVAAVCISAIRGRAALEVREQLQPIYTAHNARWKPRNGWLGLPESNWPPGAVEALREAVLELFPEDERDDKRAGRWFPGHVPNRVTNRLRSVTARPRVAAATARMVELVRDVLGNPFRPAAIQPEWREWNFGAVVQIAGHITTTGSYADVPILADALEEAGCRDEEVLRHCRTGVHVPGCWVVDAVLGRG